MDYANNVAQPEIRQILDSIITAPVSPELTPEKDGKIQSTEDLIGPYGLHDFFLFNILRNGFSKSKVNLIANIAFSGDYSTEEVKKWLDLFYRKLYTNQYKRTTLPADPKVGTVSLSPRGDWRMPDEVEPNGEDK